jgi:hypothetical protein
LLVTSHHTDLVLSLNVQGSVKQVMPHLSWQCIRITYKKLWEETIAHVSSIIHGPHRKRHIQKFFYCCVCICCHGNSFTETLPSDRDIVQQPNHCLAIRYTGEICSAGLGTKSKNIVIGPDGVRNQERRCSQGPAAIPWTGLEPRMIVLMRPAAIYPTYPDRSWLAVSRGAQKPRSWRT